MQKCIRSNPKNEYHCLHKSPNFSKSVDEIAEGVVERLRALGGGVGRPLLICRPVNVGEVGDSTRLCLERGLVGEVIEMEEGTSYSRVWVSLPVPRKEIEESKSKAEGENVRGGGGGCLGRGASKGYAERDIVAGHDGQRFSRPTVVRELMTTTAPSFEHSPRAIKKCRPPKCYPPHVAAILPPSSSLSMCPLLTLNPSKHQT